MFHSSTMRKSRYERPSPQLTSPVSTVTDLSPHFRFEKQIKTVQTWCFCTKKKNDWSWGLLMENLKYWLLIGRANLILTNGLSFTVCSQPFGKHSPISRGEREILKKFHFWEEKRSLFSQDSRGERKSRIERDLCKFMQIYVNLRKSRIERDLWLRFSKIEKRTRIFSSKSWKLRRQRDLWSKILKIENK